MSKRKHTEHVRPPLNRNSPVEHAKFEVRRQIGANIYGRVEQFLRYAEVGQDQDARQELLLLLRFFPKRSDPA